MIYLLEELSSPVLDSIILLKNENEEIYMMNLV